MRQNSPAPFLSQTALLDIHSPCRDLRFRRCCWLHNYNEQRASARVTYIERMTYECCDEVVGVATAVARCRLYVCSGETTLLCVREHVTVNCCDNQKPGVIPVIVCQSLKMTESSERSSVREKIVVVFFCDESYSLENINDWWTQVCFS